MRAKDDGKSLHEAAEEAVSEVKGRVGKNFKVNMDAVLAKGVNERSDHEQKAVDAYLQELHKAGRRKSEVLVDVLNDAYERGYAGAKIKDSELRGLVKALAQDPALVGYLTLSDPDLMTTLQNGYLYGRYSDEQLRVLLDYARMRVHAEGYKDGRESERAATVNRQSGRQELVTLKSGERKVYVTDGVIVADGDGVVDRRRSSEVLTVRDAATGKMEMISSGDVLRYEGVPEREPESVVEADGPDAVESPEGDTSDAPKETWEGGKYSLSDSDSGRGGRFVQDEHGNINLVEIPQEIFNKIKVSPLPFRLTESMVAHVYKQHGNELGLDSLSEAAEFVVEVMRNVDHVREGDNGTFIFSVENGRMRIGKRAIAIVVNAQSGDFMGIKTSGYDRLKSLQQRPLLWEKGANETSATGAAPVNVTSEPTSQSGEPTGSASNQNNGLSGDKDSESSSDVQVVAGAPADYVRGMVLTIRDDDGEVTHAMVSGRGRAEGGKYVPDETGNLIEYVVDGVARREHVSKLGERVVSHVPMQSADEGFNHESTLNTRNKLQSADSEKPLSDSDEPVEPELAPMAMRKVGRGKSAHEVPDVVSAGVERSVRYITEELPEEIRRDFVRNGVDGAESRLKKAKEARKKIKLEGIDTNRYNAETAAADAEIATAERELGVWTEIRNRMDERERAERDAREAADRATLERAVEAEAERQAAELARRAEQEARGAHAVHPAIKQKWENAKKVEGFESEIPLPNGEKVSGRYVLVESGAATPSHNAAEGFAKNEGFPVDENGNTVNDRDYERDKSAQDITRTMADNYDSRAIYTIPVVSRDGVVLSGNGRTIAGEIAAEQGTDRAYIEHLMKYGRQYGFTAEQVSGMEHPRVLFMADGDMPYTAETFAKFNAQEMKSQSRTEQAVKLGKTVDGGTFGRVISMINGYDSLSDFYGDRAAVTEAINDLRRSGVVNDMQYAEMFDGDTVSPIGQQMLEGMLIGKAFESNPDAVRQLSEHPSMRQRVVAALAEISSNARLGEEYSLETELAEAINLASSALKNGYKHGDHVSAWARQGNLFEFDLERGSVADYTNAAILLLADLLNHREVNKLKKALALYNRDAAKAAAGMADMFVGGVRSKADILKDILNLLDYGDKKEQDAALARAAEQRKRDSGGPGGEDAGTKQAGVAGRGGEGNGSAERGAGEEHSLGKTGDRSVSEWFGPIYTQFEGKATEAEAYLRETNDGVAKGALTYPGVAPIDLVWGDMNAGYMKIVIKHPEVVGKLQEILSSTTIKSQSDNRIVFESDTHKMIVSRMKGSQPTDNWLLTAYEKKEKPVSASSSDIETEPEGKRNGTATPQNGASSGGKVSESSVTSKGKGEKVAENQTPNAVQAALAAAEQETNTEPTEAQKKAGNYKKGHVKIDGYDVTIEQPKGSVRRGTDASGKQWEQEMHNTYGYIRGTEGVDGDHIDVFLSDDPSQGDVFVVDQVNKDGTFDEHKVMYGFPDIESARKAYLSNYEDGWQGLGAITQVSKEEFKKWIDSSHRKTKPFAQYKGVKPLAGQSGEQPKEPTVKAGEGYVSAAERQLEELKRQAEREGGHILILPSEGTEEAGGLSSRTLDLSSTGEGTDLFGNEQGSGKKSPSDGKTWLQRVAGEAGAVGERERVLRDALVEKLRGSGIKVIMDAAEGQRVLDAAKRADEILREMGKRKSASETASVPDREHHHAVISVAEDGAKVLQNLETLAKKYENISGQRKNFLNEVGQILGTQQYGSNSQYADFEAANGQVFTIRLADHNAHVSGFDNEGRSEGISIVVTPKNNLGIDNDGKAHLVEFYYNSIKLRKAEGSPYAAIVRSIEQALYSGEYRDTTGLAQREEVNAENVIREMRVWHGSGAEFDAFDHSHMGEGEGAQAYGWGTYVTQVEGIGRAYARSSGGSRVFYDGREVDPHSRGTLAEQCYAAVARRVLDGKMTAGEYIAERLANFDMQLVRWRESGKEQFIADTEKMRDVFASMDAELFELVEGPAVLYEVEVPDNDGGNYLQYDKQMGAQGDALERIDNELTARGWHRSEQNDVQVQNQIVRLEKDGKDIILRPVQQGRDLYAELENGLGSARAASEFLRDCGFTGIVYPAEFRSGGRSDGAKNYVIFDEADAKIVGKTRFFRTADGEVYGYTKGGKIYLDPRIATAETAVHEYAHLWAEALRGGNAAEWANVVKLMRGTGLWDEVKRDYPELKTDDEVAEEVLARFSGRRGAERLRAAQEAAVRKAGGVVEASHVISSFEKVKQAIKRFWRAFADFMHIHYESAEEVADRVLADLLDGLNPGESGRVNEQSTGREAGEEIKLQKAVGGYDVDVVPFHRVIDEMFDNADFDKSAHQRERYDLGVTPEWMKGVGITGENFSLSFKNIKTHQGKDADHNLTREEWHQLPEALKMPFLVTKRKDASDKFRLYVNIIHNGHYVAVGVDVKRVNQGKNKPMLEVNSIKTVFGHKEKMSANEVVLTYDKNITPEQEALLRGLDYREYPTIQELSAANVRNNSDIAKVKRTMQEDRDDVTEDTAMYRIREDEAGDIHGENFKNWFGDWENDPDEASKVVDESGRPKVVLHGTPNTDFHEFRDDMIGSANDPGWLGRGFYFYGNNPEYARQYANGGRVMEVYLNIRNPYYATVEDMERLAEANSAEASREFRERLEAEGYDGVYYNGDLNEEWVAFHPNQIKSATDNVGTYDSNNDDVRYRIREDEPANVRRMTQEDRDMMRSAVEQAAAKLGAPVDVYVTAEEVTHSDAAEQARRRESKGWWDPKTGRIGIVLGNNRDVDDALATMGHETIAHYGLREMIGEERYNEFLDEVYSHLREDLKKGVDDAAGRSFMDDVTKNREKSRSYEHHRRTAVDELFGRLAEKPFEEFSEGERTLWRRLKSKVRELLDRFLVTLGLPKWFELGDNELRYMLWRSKERLERGREHPIEYAHDVAKRVELGLDGETLYRPGDETEDLWNDSSLGLDERTTLAAARLASLHSEDRRQTLGAMRAIGGNLSNLRRAMGLQKRFDRTTVKRVADLARVLIATGHLSDLSKGEVKRLLSAVKNATGHSDIDGDVQKVMDIMVDNQLKRAEDMFEKLLRVRDNKIDQNGVRVMGALDTKGQRMIKALRSALKMRSEDLDARISDCVDRLDSSDSITRGNAESELEGLMLARKYRDGVGRIESEIESLEREVRLKEEQIYDFERVAVVDGEGAEVLKQDGEPRTTEKRRLKPEFKNPDDDAKRRLKQVRAEISALEDGIRASKLDLNRSYMELLPDLGGSVAGSITRGKSWLAKEEARRQEIWHAANSDLMGVDVTTQGMDPADESGLRNTGLVRFLLGPMASFEKMLRYFGQRSAYGEGRLYQKFMRGHSDCTDREWRNYKRGRDEMDAKAKDLFGVKWMQVGAQMRDGKKFPMIEIEYTDNGKLVKDSLRQDEAAYLIAVNKMVDGRIKLAPMGLTDDVIAEIAERVDPRMLELADWYQHEFLPKSRERYNEVYERMFGAPMAEIENYIHLVINTKDVPQNKEIGKQGVDATPSTITGSLKERTRNSMPLRLHTSLVDVAMGEHAKMERWAAWAEYNRDLKDLLNYKRFRAKVENMSSVEFGSGSDLLKKFEDACAVVSGDYTGAGSKSEVDRLATNWAKGVATAKINFRTHTALKQLLSFPAFMSDARPGDIMYCVANPEGSVKWAMENLPGFSKRWESRRAGDTRLMETDSDYAFWRNKFVKELNRYGMTMNAGVDCLTVAMGARAVYMTALRRYRSYGYSDIAIRRATELLMQNGTGSVLGLLSREGVGDIALAWGNRREGLCHAILRHVVEQSDYESVDELLSALRGTIMEGRVTRQGDDVVFNWKGNRAVVTKDETGNYVLTVYDVIRAKASKKRSEADATSLYQSIFGAANGNLVSQHSASVGKNSGFTEDMQAIGNNRFGTVYRWQGEDLAKKKALQDAYVSYNSSQQSSEGAFVSAQQIEGTLGSAATTVFRNASMGYERRLTTGMRNLRNMSRKGYKAEVIENTKKQMMEEGLTEDQASRAAERVYNRAVWHSMMDVANFGFALPFLWYLGPALWYVIAGDDEDESEEMLKDAATHALFGPIEGFTLGGTVSELGNTVLSTYATGGGWDDVKKSLRYKNMNPMPMLSDAQSLFNSFSTDAWQGMNDLTNLLVQAGVGVNPQTLTDVGVAILDATNGDMGLAKESAFLIMRILQVPQSQLDELFIDEIGLTARDAGKLSASEIAKRWAQYKRRRMSPLTGMAYSDERVDEIDAKMIKRFQGKLEDRISRLDDKTVMEGVSNRDELLGESYLKEAKKRMEGMETDALGEAFDAGDESVRSLASKELAKRSGLSKAPLSDSKTDYNKVYAAKRTYVDLADDITLAEWKKRVDEGSDERMKTVMNSYDKRLKALRKMLGQGRDAEVMEEIRRVRGEALRERNNR